MQSGIETSASNHSRVPLHDTHLKLLHLQCPDNLFRLRLLWRLLLQSAGSRLRLLGCCLLEDGLPA